MVPHARRKRQRLLEVFVSLSWEPNDHIGRERDVRHGRAQPTDELQVVLSSVAAAHARSTRDEPD